MICMFPSTHVQNFVAYRVKCKAWVFEKQGVVCIVELWGSWIAALVKQHLIWYGQQPLLSSIHQYECSPNIPWWKISKRSRKSRLKSPSCLILWQICLGSFFILSVNKIKPSLGLISATGHLCPSKFHFLFQRNF